MANVTVSSTIDALLRSADATEAKSVLGSATSGSVSPLSSNALALAEKEWPIKTVTWASNQTLTYTGGSSTAGHGVVIAANVTTGFVLTVTPTASTIYRNGAVTALSGTISVPVGKHRFVFWTPDDGATLYMEDTVFSAVDVPVAATPTNYTAATADVEAHLAGIDTALASVGGGYRNFIKAAQALGSSIKAQTVGVDASLIASGSNMTSGVIYWAAVYLPVSASITGVKWYQKTIGSYTGDAFNGVALYTYSGGTLTQVAISANTANAWQTAASGTIGSLAFTAPYSAASGLYFVAALYHQSAQTTAPSIGNGGSLDSAGVAALDLTNSAKLYGTISGGTSLPSPTQAMSGITGATPRWFALY